MRPRIEPSNDLALSSPFRSWLDCTTNTSGYDFRKGQPCIALRQSEIIEGGPLPTPRLAFFTIVATLAYLGLAILGVLLTALLIPPLIARIGAEETLLRTQFGGEYVAYRGRTWRLIPGIY
jgi:hypothetical protein